MIIANATRATPVDLMNGSIGIVEKPTPKGVIAVFDDAEATRAEITAAVLSSFKRTWASTVHKVQGSAFQQRAPGCVGNWRRAR